MITNYGKNRVALLVGGSATNYPTYFLLGIGSGTAAVTQTTLISGSDAQIFTSTTYPTAYKVTFQGDWNSVEMSGIQLREFGVSSGSIVNGSVWSRTALPALTFDGTNELRIESTWEVY